jgi:Na+-driven multidrug efflux pump
VRDLTQGAIWRHLVGMAMFIAASLIVQTLYMLIDLYFVSRLGKEAVAGVASAGSAMFITMSISQLVSAGSLSLVSHAVGRKDQADAQLVFEQALSLALVITAVFLVIGYGLGGWAAGRLAASPPTRRPPIMRALIFSITCRHWQPCFPAPPWDRRCARPAWWACR